MLEIRPKTRSEGSASWVMAIGVSVDFDGVRSAITYFVDGLRWVGTAVRSDCARSKRSSSSISLIRASAASGVIETECEVERLIDEAIALEIEAKGTEIEVGMSETIGSLEAIAFSIAGLVECSLGLLNGGEVFREAIASTMMLEICCMAAFSCLGLRWIKSGESEMVRWRLDCDWIGRQGRSSRGDRRWVRQA